MSVNQRSTPASAGAGVVRAQAGQGSERSKHDALYDVIRFVRPLHLALARSVERELRGTGVTMGMRAVLEVVDAYGPATVPSIGRVLAVGRQPVQRIVNAAKALGLVSLESNPAHKRSALVALTAEGESAFRAIREREQQNLKRVARDLSRVDIVAAIRVLGALSDAFQSKGEIHDGC